MTSPPTALLVAVQQPQDAAEVLGHRLEHARREPALALLVETIELLAVALRVQPSELMPEVSLRPSKH